MLTTLSLTCQLQPQNQLPTLLPLQGIPCYPDKLPPGFLHWRILNAVVTVNPFGAKHGKTGQGGKSQRLWKACLAWHQISTLWIWIHSSDIYDNFTLRIHWPHMIYTLANTLYCVIYNTWHPNILYSIYSKKELEKNLFMPCLQWPTLQVSTALSATS